MMKRNAYLIFITVIVSSLVLTNCSKDESLTEEKQNDTVINEAKLISDLEELGIDASIKFAPEGFKSAPFLEAYEVYKMEYQDIWFKTKCKFNSDFCAPEGMDYIIQFYIYYLDTGTSFHRKTVTKHCWENYKTSLSDWFPSGYSNDILVYGIVYLVEEGQGGGTYVGIIVSNSLNANIGDTPSY